jgi:hypothetical protein
VRTGGVQLDAAASVVLTQQGANTLTSGLDKGSLVRSMALKGGVALFDSACGVLAGYFGVREFQEGVARGKTDLKIIGGLDVATGGLFLAGAAAEFGFASSRLAGPFFIAGLVVGVGTGIWYYFAHQKSDKELGADALKTYFSDIGKADTPVMKEDWEDILKGWTKANQ